MSDDAAKCEVPECGRDAREKPFMGWTRMCQECINAFAGWLSPKERKR